MSTMYSYLILLAAFGVFQANAANKTVNIGLYYESLCPYSRDFIINQLVPTYRQLSSSLNVNLVPYGNAKFTKVNTTEGQFEIQTECQHGVQECLGNRIHSCVIPNESTNRSLELINCIFNEENWKEPAVAGEKCAKAQKLDWPTISECAYGPLGRGLLLLNAEKDALLSPKKSGVPWVTLNGQHTDDIQSQAQTDLLKLVSTTIVKLLL